RHPARLVAPLLQHLTRDLGLKVAADVQRERPAPEEARPERPAGGDGDPGEERDLDVHQLHPDPHGCPADRAGEPAALLRQQELELHSRRARDAPIEEDAEERPLAALGEGRLPAEAGARVPDLESDLNSGKLPRGTGRCREAGEEEQGTDAEPAHQCPEAILRRSVGRASAPVPPRRPAGRRRGWPRCRPRRPWGPPCGRAAGTAPTPPGSGGPGRWWSSPRAPAPGAGGPPRPPRRAPPGPPCRGSPA